MKIELSEVTPGGIARIFWFYGLAWLEAVVKLFFGISIFVLVVIATGINMDTVKSVVPFPAIIASIYLAIGHLWFFSKRLYAHFFAQEAAKKKLSDCTFREIYIMLH